MFTRFLRLGAECRTLLEDRSDVFAVAVLRKWMYVIVLPFLYRHDEVEGCRARHRLLYSEYHRSSQKSWMLLKIPTSNPGYGRDCVGRSWSESAGPLASFSIDLISVSCYFVYLQQRELKLQTVVGFPENQHYGAQQKYGHDLAESHSILVAIHQRWWDVAVFDKTP